MIERGAQRVEDPDLQEYYTCFLRDVMKTSRSYQSRLNEGMKVIYAGVEARSAILPPSGPSPKRS